MSDPDRIASVRSLLPSLVDVAERLDAVERRLAELERRVDGD